MGKIFAMAALGALPLIAFTLDVGGSLAFEPGYRFDEAEYNVTGLGSTTKTKFKEISALSLALGGKLTLDDAYIRATGDYAFILKAPLSEVFVNGAKIGDQRLSKEGAWDVLGAVGYTFCLGDGEFKLSPELGFAFSHLELFKQVVEGTLVRFAFETGTGFAGCDFKWMFSQEWTFGLLFNFHFIGFSKLVLEPQAVYTKPLFFGPEAKLSFDYFLSENWSIGAAYRFKYLFTNKADERFEIDSLSADIQIDGSWMTNNATINVTYTF